MKTKKCNIDNLQAAFAANLCNWLTELSEGSITVDNFFKKFHGSMEPMLREIFEEPDRLAETEKELHKYLQWLCKEAELCRNEALRALEKFEETGEPSFRINDAVLETPQFLQVIKRIMTFDIPFTEDNFFASADHRSLIKSYMKKIAKLHDHLFKIPGARFSFKNTPDVYKKINIRKEVVFSGVSDT